jgi:hypothetical protein
MVPWLKDSNNTKRLIKWFAILPNTTKPQIQCNLNSILLSSMLNNMKAHVGNAQYVCSKLTLSIYR